MTEANCPAELLIRVLPGPNGNEIGTESAIENLMEELRSLPGLRRISRAPGELLPAGSKAGGERGLGDILIALGTAGGILPALGGLLKDWLGRQKQLPSIEIEYREFKFKLSAELSADEIINILKHINKIKTAS